MERKGALPCRGEEVMWGGVFPGRDEKRQFSTDFNESVERVPGVKGLSPTEMGCNLQSSLSFQISPICQLQESESWCQILLSHNSRFYVYITFNSTSGKRFHRNRYDCLCKFIHSLIFKERYPLGIQPCSPVYREGNSCIPDSRFF